MPSFICKNLNIETGRVIFTNCNSPVAHSSINAHFISELKDYSDIKYLSNYYSKFVCFDDWESKLPVNANLVKITLVLQTHQDAINTSQYYVEITANTANKNYNSYNINKSKEVRLDFTSEMGIKEFKGILQVAMESTNKQRRSSDTDLPERTIQVPDKMFNTNLSNTKYYNSICFFPETIKKECYWYKTDKENAPYLIFEYEYKPPEKPGSLAPTGETLSPRGEILFSWNTKTDQNSFELQYKTEESGWTTIRKDTSDRKFILEANKIKSQTGTVDWKVRIKDSSGKWSEWASSYFTLGNLKQPPPIIITPNGDFLKAGSDFIFEWIFKNNSVSEKQKSFELKYTLDGKNWKTVTKTTEESKFILSETENLNSATGKWKIKVTNNFGESSDFTEESTFQIIGKPTSPQILEVINDNFPTIRWQAKDQDSFILKIYNLREKLIFSSGIILGYANYFDIPEFVENGDYIAKLKTINKFGIGSNYTEYSFKINTQNLIPSQIFIQKTDYSLKITTDDRNGIVYRNNIPVGRIDGSIFEDYSVENGKNYNYKILKISEKKGIFSKEITENIQLKNNTIAKLSDLSNFMILKWNLNEAPKRQTSYKREFSEISIIGQNYPVIEFGDEIKEIYNYQFVLDSINEVNELKKLSYSKEEVLFRDVLNTNVIGILTDVTSSKLKINKYQVNFKIIKTKDDIYE